MNTIDGAIVTNFQIFFDEMVLGLFLFQISSFIGKNRFEINKNKCSLEKNKHLYKVHYASFIKVN